MTAKTNRENAALAVFFTLLGTGSGYYVGHNHGVRHERQESAAYVSNGMAKAGFCRWWKISNFPETCAEIDRLGGKE